MFRSINKNRLITFLFFLFFSVSLFLLIITPFAKAGPYINVAQSGVSYYASNMTQTEIDALISNRVQSDGSFKRPNIIYGLTPGGERTSFIYLGNRGDFYMYQQLTSSIDDGLDCRSFFTIRQGVPATGSVEGGSVAHAYRSGNCGSPNADYDGVDVDGGVYNFLNVDLKGNDDPGYPASIGGEDDGSSGGSGDASQSCYDVISAPFSWLLCGIANVAADFVDSIENFIKTLLRVNEVSPDSDLYKSWASVRNLAASVIVLVSLVAIASQIFNLNFVSAYTIKKIIPKILVAAIALFLSFFLADLAIRFFNGLGDGIEAFLLAPFGDLLTAVRDERGLDYIMGQLSGVGGGEAGTAAALFAGAGITAFAGAGGVGGLIIAIGLIIAAFVVGFVALVLRKVLIILLVVMMPLAIAAWILPSTEKWAKQWWDLFSKLLLMYPLVVALLAAGKIAAYLLAQGVSFTAPASIPGLTNTIQFAAIETSVAIIMVLVAYFGPFFFIPAMFRLAGGVFAKLNNSMEGFGKKYGRKASEGAGERAKGYVAAKYYKANDPSRVGKLRNFAARSITGNIGPTTRSAMLAAQTGGKYVKERNEEADFLMDNAYDNLDYNNGGRMLEEQAARGKNSAVRNAALRKIVATGRLDILDKVAEATEYTNSDGQTRNKVLDYADESSSFAKEVAGRRKDLLARDNAPGKVQAMSAQELLNQHDSVFGSIGSDGRFTESPTIENAQTRPQAAIDQIRNNEILYNKLGAAGKAYVDTIGGPTFTPTGAAPSGGGGGSPAPAPSGGGGGSPTPAPSGGGGGGSPAPAPSGGGGGSSPTPPTNRERGSTISASDARLLTYSDIRNYGGTERISNEDLETLVRNNTDPELAQALQNEIRNRSNE